MEQVILVDSNDKQIGLMEKMEAHQKGKLHRAFSVLIFNDKGEMLIQKRADSKYHSAGLWSNACCSHPRSNENMQSAVNRRIKEELSIDVSTEFSHKFIYKTSLENGMIEHELDYVFMGLYSNEINPNEKEVSDWKYISIKALETDIQNNPNNYTIWFKLIMQNMQQFLVNKV